MSIPSILYGVAKGGDHIDRAVGAVVSEHATRVKVIKEESLDLSRPPKEPLFLAKAERFSRPQVLEDLKSWHFSFGDSEGAV